ncbi:MAG: TonB-dependent receptor plug domain-containing protein [Methylococcales bacterium]|nr:TonB-dependent receptor plug domain-containing protein [Methylococcales bacterium]
MKKRTLNKKSLHRHTAGSGSAVNFTSARILMLATGVWALAPGVALAQNSQADVAAELARLRQELAATRQENELLKNALSTQPVSEPVVTETLDVLAEPQAEEFVAEETFAETNTTDALGEVVVKARPRLRRLKEAPVSASVVTGEALTREVAYDMDQILARVGNAQRFTHNSRVNGIAVRGVGGQFLFEALDPSVGAVEDGVAYTYSALASFDHYDLANVQVDRGPTGTDFGKNYGLGRISFTPRHPTFTKDANLSLTYGDFNTYIVDGAVGGPVVDDLLAYRAAIHINKTDGQIKNAFNPSQTFFNRDRLQGRFQLLFTPTEDFSGRVSFEFVAPQDEFFNSGVFHKPTPQFFANGAANNSLTPERRLSRRWFVEGNRDFTLQDFFSRDAFNMDLAQGVKNESKGGVIDLNWYLDDDTTVTAITGIRDYSFRASNDERTPFDVNRSLLSGGHTPYVLHASQEVRLKSKFEDLVDYQVGGLYVKRITDQYTWAGRGSDAGAWYARDAEFALLDADSNGRQLMKDSLDGLVRREDWFVDNDSGSLFANAEWHVAPKINLVTGARVNYEHRVQKTRRRLLRNGVGELLNDKSVNDTELGGFDANNQGELSSAALTDPNQIAVADAVARQYFGIDQYADLSAEQKAQVGAAKRIRRGQIGNLWQLEPGNTFEAFQPTFIVSPSYKFNDDLTGYVSWRYNKKAGGSQSPNGVAVRVKAETSNAFEIGFKSALLDNTLDLHVDYFWNKITNYQQRTLVLDEFTTNIRQQADPNALPAFIDIVGNAKGVEIMGVEIDGSYTGIPYTTINFNGAWNRAVYTNFKNSPVPVELQFPGGPVLFDATGKTLPFAPKFTFSISPDVRYPFDLAGIGAEAHGSFTTTFSSRTQTNRALSKFGWIGANTSTDFSVGLGRQDGLFDVSMVGTNIFNNQEPIGVTWNTITPRMGRWLGVRVSSAF